MRRASAKGKMMKKVTAFGLMVMLLGAFNVSAGKVIKVTSTSLIKMHKQNPIMFTQKIKGKSLVLKGKITGFPVLGERRYLELDKSIEVQILGKDIKTASKLKLGDYVVTSCVYDGSYGEDSIYFVSKTLKKYVPPRKKGQTGLRKK